MTNGILVVEEVKDVGKQLHPSVGDPGVVEQPDIDDPEGRVAEPSIARNPRHSIG